MMTTSHTDPSTVTADTPPRPAQVAEGMNSIPTEGSVVKPDYPIENIDNQPVYLIDQLAGFRSALPTFGPSAQKSYAKALTSLESFMRTASLQYEPLSTTILADWLITLSLSGHTLSTLLLYLNAISSCASCVSEPTGPTRRVSPIEPIQSIRAASAPTNQPVPSRSLSMPPNSVRLPQAASAPEPSPLTSLDFGRLRSILKEIQTEAEAEKPTTSTRPDRTNRPTSPLPASLLRALHLTATLAGGLSLETAARLRREDLPSLPPEAASVASPFTDPRRRYIFPLDQSSLTTRQLAHRLAEAFATASDPALRAIPTPAEHWLRTALSIGATPSEAITALGRNPLPGNPILRLLPCASAPTETPVQSMLTASSPTEESVQTMRAASFPTEEPVQSMRAASFPTEDPVPSRSLSVPPNSVRFPRPETSSRLWALVAEALTDNPLHWYALRLRQGITPEELLSRLKSGPAVQDRNPDNYFYPTHRVAHRTPSGVHHTTEPLLPGVIFLRLRSTELTPLLREIGDIAWIYRDPARRDSGYSPIPDRQMNAFQLAIGVFTDETRVAPLGTIAPRPGQRILILGGPLAGHTATFVKGIKDPRGIKNAVESGKSTAQSMDSVLYRLILPGLNGIEWEADLDPRILQLLN